MPITLAQIDQLGKMLALFLFALPAEDQQQAMQDLVDQFDRADLLPPGWNPNVHLEPNQLSQDLIVDNAELAGRLSNRSHDLKQALQAKTLENLTNHIVLP